MFLVTVLALTFLAGFSELVLKETKSNFKSKKIMQAYKPGFVWLRLGNKSYHLSVLGFATGINQPTQSY
jgi:hypothetical protein